MWYKLKRIMMRTNGVEKQVRPSGWWWKPWANTLWYLNLNQSNSVFTDTQWHTVTNNWIVYDANWVSEWCWFNNSNWKRLYSDFNTWESFPSSFTIMWFMKPANDHFTSDHPMWIVLSDGTNKRLWGIWFTKNNTKAQFSFLAENVAWTTKEYNATDSWWTWHEWHHFALTYDGTTMIGYIDWNQVISQAISWNGTGSYPLPWFSVFGRERSDQSFTNTIYGYVDEAICEDKVWTAQEIQDYLALYSY
jgi:hypothetical protein